MLVGCISRSSIHLIKRASVNQCSSASRNVTRSLHQAVTVHPHLPSHRPTAFKMTSAVQSSSSRSAPGHPGQPGFFPSFSTVNFYAGSELSRFSWLRSDSKFLNSALTSPKTRFVLLQNLNPLVHTAEGEDNGKLATLSWKDVESTIRESMAMSHEVKSSSSSSSSSSDVFGPEANHLQAAAADAQDQKKFSKITEGLVPTSLAMVFLGVDERGLDEASLPGDLTKKEGTSKVPAGIPYFALSLSYRPDQHFSESMGELPTERLQKRLLHDGKYDFVDTRTLAQAGTWELHDAAVVAQARSLIDWNERHKVSATFTLEEKLC